MKNVRTVAEASTAPGHAPRFCADPTEDTVGAERTVAAFSNETFYVRIENGEVFLANFRSFTLKNFKGAEDVTLDLAGRVNSPVITLIGLNESGKTTILEGLSYFVTGDNDVSSLFGANDSESIITGLIPVHRKAAFTGEITMSALVELDDEDFNSAAELAKKYKLQLSRDSFQKLLRVRRDCHFADSVLQAEDEDWDLELTVKPDRKGAKDKIFERSETGIDLWDEIVQMVTKKLPRIAYFPTFLVDMPERIYLKKHEDELPINRYYRYVFQEILDGIDEGLSLEKHVLKRIEDFKAAEKNTPAWYALFWGGPSKATIDSVFQRISSAVTKEVLGSWQKVFGSSIAAKSISIDWNIDTQKGDLPYASFVVSDGESLYAISERSLGFRWFFSFLLFTGFKRALKRPTLFVFDEPAANLHAKAQAELLKSFSRLVSEGHRIVYSTHSHHMINPTWLSGAYIVENDALDYDSSDAFGLSTKPTNIKVTSYRQFVSQYPARTSYFQPVIEKLQYVTPEIIGAGPLVILEGVSDFYAFSLVRKLIDYGGKFSLMPGAGASGAGPLISLLLGRGEKFIILLDDDKSGRVAAKRYREEWYLPSSMVLTLKDVDAKWEHACLEGLISADTLELIGRKYGFESKPTKNQIGLYLAEMCAVTPDANCIDMKTKENIGGVLASLDRYLANQ